MAKRRPLLVFLFLACVGYISCQEWDASNYPNPTTSGFKQCNMRSPSNLCDPDQILSESDRYRLNSELTQLEAKTNQGHGRNYCEKKGISGAIALARRVKGGTQQAVQAMANDMLRKWVLDRQCQKAIVIVISVDDRKFWIARGPKVPVYGQELTDIFDAQKQLFASGDYSRALQNVLRAIEDATLAKQGPGTGPAPGGGGDRRPVQPQPGSPGDRGKQEPFKWPISPWILLGIVIFVVIPLLCCCGCIYFCCCRNKDGNRRQGPYDGETGGGGQPFTSSGGGGASDGRSGGGFGNFGNILGGIGGGAAISGLMNRFRNRGGGGGGAPPAGGYPPQGGGTYPPDQYAGGKQPGLYPSAPKDDQGGGGGW